MTAARKQQLVALGAVVLALVIVAGGYLMVLSPKRSKAAQIEDKIATTEAKLRVAESASQSPAANAERVKIADLYRLSRAMPDGSDMAGVLLDLGRAAAGAGVSLQTITPGTPTPAPAGGYETIPIGVDFQGRYGQLTGLLANLRQLVSVHDGALDAGGRLFSVDDVNFSAGEAGLPQVKAHVDLEAYVFAPAVAAAPPPTTTDTTTSSDSTSAAGAGGTG